MDERRLRKFFHFTEDDLFSNRRGQFSKRQMEKLRQAAKAEHASARSSAAILFVIATAGLVVGLTISFIAPTLMGRVLILLLMGVLWPTAWAGKGIRIIRAANILQDPQLRQVSGPVRIVKYGGGEYALQVEGLEFDVDGNPFNAVVEGEKYRVYYVEATEEILSVDDSILGNESTPVGRTDS